MNARAPHATKAAWAWGCALLIAIGAAVTFRNLFFFENLHPVIEGEVYRSAQPTARGLERAVTSLGLRSVINLKGSAPGTRDDFATEFAAAANVEFRSVRLSARRLPSPQEVERLVEALDSTPRPTLLHCHSGTDRSGLASAIALLLANRPLDEAEAQFALRFGYPGESIGSDLPGFLAQYRAWLASHGRSASADEFRAWVASEYIAYYYEAEIEFELPARPLRAGEAFAFGMRVTNRSPQAIPMRCTEGAGVRVSVRLASASPDLPALPERRFCDGDRDLAPGESTTIRADDYLLAAPGRYRLTADLVDEFQEHFFADMGSRRAMAALQVH